MVGFSKLGHICSCINIKLHNDSVVCSMPNLIKLCYSLAIEEQFSIIDWGEPEQAPHW